MLGNTTDVVQDAILAAYAHLDQFKGWSEMSTSVTAIVHNCAQLQLRRQKNHVRGPFDEPRERKSGTFGIGAAAGSQT